MGDSTRWYADRGLMLVACMLAISMQPAAGGRAGSQRADEPNGAAVDEVRLERNCFGCPSGSLLLLKRDGTATLTATGNARHGTPDRTSRGRVLATDFDQVARMLTMQRFFELNDEYADPQRQDGEWYAITATRGGQEKAVYRRNGAGPPALDAIERAIEAVRARIAWRADPQ